MTKLFALGLMGALALAGCMDPKDEDASDAALHRGVVVLRCPGGDTIMRDPATNRLILNRVHGDDAFLDQGVTPDRACPVTKETEL